MDRKLIKYVFLTIVVIVLSGLFITTSFAIDLPWEKEKKDDTRQELPPPPKIPGDTPKPSSLENPKKYFDEGVAYEKDKKYNEAISSYTRAIELNRNYAEAYFQRGYSKCMIGNYEEALSDFNKAIELDPKYDLVYLSRGYSKEEFLKDVQGAIRDYEKALEIYPNYEPAKQNLERAKKKL